MIDKIKGLLGSIRFWIITFGWLAVYLGVIEEKGFDWTGLFDQIAIWLGTVAGVGTVDSVAERLSK